MSYERLGWATLALVLAGLAATGCRDPIEPAVAAETRQPVQMIKQSHELPKQAPGNAPQASPAAAPAHPAPAGAPIAAPEPAAATPATASADDEFPCSHGEPSATAVPDGPPGAGPSNCSMP